MTGKFQKSTNGFSYYFSKMLSAGEEVILKMPATTPNKRGVCDIGFSLGEGVRLFATLASVHSAPEAIWQEIDSGEEINRTVAWLKLKCEGESAAAANIRVIMF